MPDSFYISWTAPEHSEPPKGISWYWLSIILSILMLGLAVWQKNYLFGFFILVAEMLILKWAGHAPRMMDFKLTERGLTIGEEKFYPLSEFKSFNIEKDETEEEDLAWIDVNIFFKSKIKPPLRLKAPKEESGNIEQALLTVLPQIEWEPSLIEIIEKLLGF